MKRALAIVLIMGLLTPAFSSAEEADLVIPDRFVELTEESDAAEAGNFESLNQAVQQSNLVLQLKQKLAQAQYRYYLLQSNLDHAKVNLEDIRAVILNLELTIENLDAQIDDMDDQIISVKSQTEAKKVEIEELEEDVQILELQKADQLVIVQEFMELIYLNRSIYYVDNEVNALKVLASPDSVSETLQELTYLDLLEEENQMQIIELEFISKSLSLKWGNLRSKRTELEALDEELANGLDRLEEEKETQENLEKLNLYFLKS